MLDKLKAWLKPRKEQKKQANVSTLLLPYQRPEEDTDKDSKTLRAVYSWVILLLDLQRF